MHAYDPTHMIDGFGIGRSSTSMDPHCCYLASSSIQLIDDLASYRFNFLRPHMHAYIGLRKGEKASNVCTRGGTWAGTGRHGTALSHAALGRAL